MDEEFYLSKEELIQFLEDHEVNSIRIISETQGQLKTKKSRRSKTKHIHCTNTMIDITTTGKRQKPDVNWKVDSTGAYDYSTTITQDEDDPNFLFDPKTNQIVGPDPEGFVANHYF